MRCIPHLNFLFLIASLISSVVAIAGEPPSEPILRIETGEHTAMIQRIASDETGRWLVTASEDKTAKVWDLQDGRLLNTLRIPIASGNEGKLYAVALSPDGNTVALGGYTGLEYDGSTSIYLFDRSSGRLLNRVYGFRSAISDLAFSPDGQTLAVSFNGLCLISIPEGRLLAQDTDYGDASYSVSFNRDGSRLVATSIDGYLHLYQWNGKSLTLLSNQTTPGGKQPFAARFSPDGKQIAVGFYDSPAVNLFNTTDLTFAYAPNTSGVNGGFISVAWTGQGLVASGMADKPFDGKRKNYLRHWQGSTVHDTQLLADSTVMALLPLNLGRLAYIAGNSWGLVNEKGKALPTHNTANADFRGNATGLTLSADGMQVGFSYEYQGRSPAVFDSSRHTFLAKQELYAPVISAAGLNVSDWLSTDAPKLNDTPLKLNTNEWPRSLALLPDSSGFALGASWSLRLFNRDGSQRWKQAAPGEAWAVNVSQDGRWVVAAYGDGTIRWHRASDGAEQLAFFPHADKKRWVMWTPSGYYDASPGAENLIGWHVNNGKDHEADFFPASRFRERFYRPDVLSKVLETQDETEAVRLANNESGRRTQAVTAIAQALPPVVEIVSPTGDSTVQPGTIKVRYRVRTATDAPVTAMRVRVNGLLQSDTRALKRVADNDDDVKEIEVTIPEAGIQSATRALKRTGQGQASSAQEVEIQLFAENKFSTSTPAILRLQLAGGKATAKQTAASKPKLYVLAVGVSKYANPEFNLGLASKDANDFVNSLKGQKGKLYSDVVVKLLTDAQATKDDVLDGLDWLKQNVTANDVGVMFVAGHGMNDKLGGYYFMPHNADPDKLARTGVSQSEIKQTFANLPGHTVFFIDTCYSGGVMGNVRTSGFVNDLASAENGAVVFTASSAGQLSQENPSWGNGAFTKSVVEGLSGKADAFNSGAVTVKGLDFYVDGRVKSLTNGQQTPVSIAPGGLSDFPLTGGGK